MGFKHKNYAKVLMKLELARQSETDVSVVKTTSRKNCFNEIVFIDVTESTPSHSPSQMMIL